MFAVVANGMQYICKTPRQLDCICAIYPYPKFKKVRNKDEAYAWLKQNSRSVASSSFSNYGDTAKSGYAVVEYFISDNTIYANIFTENIGFIKIPPTEGVAIDNRTDLIKVKIKNIVLDDMVINHHILAIRRLLKLLGDFVDVNIKLPDMSIYLALTKYRGENYMIQAAQKEIRQRLGGVSFSVNQLKEDGRDV